MSQHAKQAAETGSGRVADVVLSGAGPAGLMLAIELCLGGVRPVVLERLPAISARWPKRHRQTDS